MLYFTLKYGDYAQSRKSPYSLCYYDLFNYFLVALEAVLNIKENGDCYISIAWSSINEVLAILRRIRLNWLGVIVVISLNLRQKAL